MSIVIAFVLGVFALFGLLALIGAWAEKHPERTAIGRDVAQRYDREVELIEARHAYELEFARLRATTPPMWPTAPVDTSRRNARTVIEARRAARSSDTPTDLSAIANLLTASESDDVVDLDAVMARHTPNDESVWWAQAAGAIGTVSTSSD